MASFRKTIVLGFDGLDPKWVERLWTQNRLPHLRRLKEQGAFSRVATTSPAQTPVAWSTFATGVNPGKHGIFDFLTRDPQRLLPMPALTSYEQKNPFLPPKAVNRRRAKALWDYLSDAGVASTVLRCPCTYPAAALKGRLLAGVGVPDMRGSFGIPTFYTSDTQASEGESENLVRLPEGHGVSFETHLPGPLSPKTRGPVEYKLKIEVDPAGRKLTIHSAGEPRSLEVPLGGWSEWLKAKFKLGLLQSVRGMARFHLARIEPRLEFYASPVQFDPAAPLFPISTPEEYAGELEARIGGFHTAGMAEDHTGLINGRLSEAAYLAQCDAVWREREAMLFAELGRFKDGLLFCLFDTPDRVQHMFRRFTETGHPANARHGGGAYGHVIDEMYERCDATAGKVLEQAGEDTLVVVLSDHGFASFRRGVDLNGWLRERGLLALKKDTAPGSKETDLLKGIDWEKTKAYAMGLGGIYLNLKGREAQGIVEAGEAEGLKQRIAAELPKLRDPAHAEATPVHAAPTREQLYAGPFVAEAPDLLVHFADGYRVSWASSLGGVAAAQVEDNVRRWSGDHVIDPAAVPGVLFANTPFRGEGARLLDLAPTILTALGVPVPADMEGSSLLP